MLKWVELTLQITDKWSFRIGDPCIGKHFSTLANKKNEFLHMWTDGTTVTSFYRYIPSLRFDQLIETTLTHLSMTFAIQCTSKLLFWFLHFSETWRY